MAPDEARTLQRFSRILIERFRVPADRITWDSRVVGGLIDDSMDDVELVMILEDEFHADFNDPAVQKIRTVGDFVSWLSKAARS